MNYGKVWIVIVVTGVIGIAVSMSAAQAAGVWAKVSGRVIGSPIRFKGWVNFSILTRKGKVTGRLQDGTNCWGSSWINFTLSGGGGKLKCGNGLSAKFNFSLSSSFPARGKGNGRLADGRKLSLKISPAK